MLCTKVCRWMDSNLRPLVSIVTTIPTEPQPTPWYYFLSCSYICCSCVVVAVIAHTATSVVVIIADVVVVAVIAHTAPSVVVIITAAVVVAAIAHISASVVVIIADGVVVPEASQIFKFIFEIWRLENESFYSSFES